MSEYHDSEAFARIGFSRSTGRIFAVPFESSGLPLHPATEHPNRECQEKDECGGDPEGVHRAQPPTGATPCQGISATRRTHVPVGEGIAIRTRPAFRGPVAAPLC